VGTRSTIAADALSAARETATPAATAGAYTFTLNSVRIARTRSLFNDTDYVCMAIIVGANPPIVSAVQYMGNVGDGTHEVNLSIPNVAVGPTDHAAFTYTIVNCGHGSSADIEEALQKAVAAAASKLAQQWATNTGTQAPAAAASGAAAGAPPKALIRTAGADAFGWLAGKIDGILFANCDGVVAGADCVFFLDEMATETAIANGNPVTYVDFSPGTNSPDGCGANSEYYVTWSFSTYPPAPAGRPVGGGDTGPSPGQPPHRLD
jgi:hypothetical protein